ncbi:MAG: tetratricopeptide repeat protein, partial [Methylocella sp.]
MGTVTFEQGRGQFLSSVRGREARKPRRWRLGALLGALLCVAIFSNPAAANRLRDGTRAFAAGDYVTAARIFTDLALLGDARAQTYLGYLFAHGQGVPQNYMVAAGWYRCASQQGFPAAEYLLGLMYDKGQGVPQNYVMAYALLDLAVAGAGR